MPIKDLLRNGVVFYMRESKLYIGTSGFEYDWNNFYKGAKINLSIIVKHLIPSK